MTFKNRKFLKYTTIIIVLGLLAHAVIVGTGNKHFYTALKHNFANIDDYKIFPARMVEKGQSSVIPLSSRYNKSNLSSKLTDLHQETESVAFLVLQNDSLVHEDYWDNYADTTISNSFSVTKSIMSCLIGIALKEGKIKSLDEPVGNYLEEFKEKDKSKIKIRHLLTMSSGLDWNEAYANPFSVTTKAYYGDNLKEIIAQLQPIKNPGEIFEYKSGDTQVLGFLLQAATGTTVSKYAEEKLWKKIGAEKDAVWSLDAENGMEKTYCCFSATARDLSRIGLLYLHKGSWKGEQILDSSYIRESWNPAPLLNLEGDKLDYYGYGWWLLPYKQYKVAYCRGIIGQYIIVIPEKNIVIVRLGHKRAAKRGKHYEDLYKMVDAVLEIY